MADFSPQYREVFLGPSGEIRVKYGRNGGAEQPPDDARVELDELARVVRENPPGALESRQLATEAETYRVATAATVNGDWHIARPLPREVPTLKATGINSVVRQALLGLSEGLVLICGAMGSGKTTTAAALVGDWLRTHGGHAVTVEDPPEMPLHGWLGAGLLCLQCDFGGASGEQILSQTVRQGGPEVVLIGEIRNAETAVHALNASLMGHLIIATVHGDSVQRGLEKLALYAWPRKGAAVYDMMAQAMAMCLHQSLTQLANQSRLQSSPLFFRRPEVADGSPVGRSLTESATDVLRGGEMHKVRNEIQRQRNVLRSFSRGER